MLKLPFSGYGFMFVFLLLMMFQTTNTAQGCPASSCGGTNISYPFRLQTDPISCGDDHYELSCENNVTVLHPIDGGKYYVKAINYENFTIRLVVAGVDQDDCSSLPSFPLPFEEYPSYSLYKYKQYSENMAEWETLPNEEISFIKCQNLVNSSVYLDTSPCINSSSSSLSHSETVYTYAYVGEMKGHDLRDGCSSEIVSLMLPIRRDSKNRINLSFIEVHRQIAFGYELSWHHINCINCNRQQCYLDNKDHIQCPSFKTAGYLAFFIHLKVYVKDIFIALGHAIRDWWGYILNLFGGHLNLDIVQKIPEQD